MSRIFLTILFPFLLFGSITHLDAQPGDDRYEPSDEFMAYQDEDGYWGFIAADETIIQQAIYDDLEFRKNSGVWVIKRGELYGFATLDGFIIQPAFKEFRIMTEEDNCEIAHVNVNRNDRWGVIALNEEMAGKWLVKAWYGPGLWYSRGHVMAKQSADPYESDWGIADTSGAVIMPFNHTQGELQFCNPHAFCHDLQNDDLTLLKRKHSKVAWYSLDGRPFSDYKYESVCCKNGPYAFAQLSEHQNGIIDTTGKEVVPCLYEGIWYLDDNEELLGYGILNDKKHSFDKNGRITEIRDLTPEEKKNWDARHTGGR